MTDNTLFSAHPVSWEKVRDLYGEAAQITGVKSWYHPEKNWQDFPATSAMVMPPEQQVIALAGQGAIALQLYIDVAREETITADFHIHELYTPPTPPPCSTSSTSPNPSEPTDTKPGTTSATSTATKPASRRASKSTVPAGAPASPPPATSEESTTT